MRKAAALLASFFLIMFLVACAGFTVTILRSHDEKVAFLKIAQAVKLEEQVPDADGAATATDTETGTQVQEALPQYRALSEENPDFAGWLTVPGTNIDYPVMRTPDEPEYYLHRAFDRSDSFSGTPFIGENGSVESDCFIIYGHNMKNDTMFGTLDYYKDPDFYAKNPTIRFDTAYEERTYAVFAAFLSKASNGEKDAFRLPSYSGGLTEDAFEELMGNIKDRMLYETGIFAEYGDQILMLSTCSYHTANGRLVVAAKRVDNP